MHSIIVETTLKAVRFATVLSICSWLLHRLYLTYRRNQAQAHIPIHGIPPHWGPLGPYLAAYRFTHDSASLLTSGYARYSPTSQSFLISTPTRYVLVATCPKLIHQLATAPESLLSQQQAANERNSMSYILSSAIHADPYHVKIILRKLTPHMATLVPELVEEAGWALGMQQGLQARGGEWAAVGLRELVTGCVSAMTNRVLVGRELARDGEFLKALGDLPAIMGRAGLLVDLAPDVGLVRRAVAAVVFPKGSGAFRVFMDKLGPVFEKRKRERGEFDDVIQWVLDAAPEGASTYDLCERILYLNFSAIVASTMNIMQSLYDLACHPDAQEEVRQEVDACLAEFGGWSKQAISKMWKLDSSVRESQRMNPVTTATMMRSAKEDITLVDGSVLPKGQWVITPAWPLNRSPSLFENPDDFDPFRFEKMRRVAGQELKHQLANPEEGYYSFGGPGKNACPGRHYAATEMKILTGYIISHYNIRIRENHDSSKRGRRNTFLSFSCLPDFDDGLEFQRRDKVNSF